VTKISTLEELEALYDKPVEAALVKEADSLNAAYRRWIEQATFFVIATSGAGYLDVSPRGDKPGHLIKVLNDRQIVIPDRRGNNRIDTLRNIVADPQVGLLFMIPGIEEVLRVRGKAAISVDPDLLTGLSMDGKLPKTAILVDIEKVYFQCARAVKRARLWQPDTWRLRADAPTAGDMLMAASGDFDGASYDAALPERQKKRSISPGGAASPGTP